MVWFRRALLLHRFIQLVVVVVSQNFLSSSIFLPFCGRPLSVASLDDIVAVTVGDQPKSLNGETDLSKFRKSGIPKSIPRVWRPQKIECLRRDQTDQFRSFWVFESRFSFPEWERTCVGESERTDDHEARRLETKHGRWRKYKVERRKECEVRRCFLRKPFVVSKSLRGGSISVSSNQGLRGRRGRTSEAKTMLKALLVQSLSVPSLFASCASLNRLCQTQARRYGERDFLATIWTVPASKIWEEYQRWAQPIVKRYDNYLGQKTISELAFDDFLIVQCRFPEFALLFSHWMQIWICTVGLLLFSSCSLSTSLGETTSAEERVRPSVSHLHFSRFAIALSRCDD